MKYLTKKYFEQLNEFLESENNFSIENETEQNETYRFEFDNKKTICLTNGKILERESKTINKWNEKNPYSGWTKLVATELFYKNDIFEIHFLFENRDLFERVTLWNYTLQCSHIYTE